MNEYDKLKEYKDLLDNGAITEEEYRLIKQKLLNLKTDEEKQAEQKQIQSEALAEVEALRRQKAEQEKIAADLARQEELAKAEHEAELERIEKERIHREKLAEIDRENELRSRQIFDEEKARKAAELAAISELKKQQREATSAKIQAGAAKAGSATMNVICWVVSVILGLLSVLWFITYFSPDSAYGIVLSITIHIAFILETLIINPISAEKLSDVPVLSFLLKHRVKSAVIIPIAWLVIAFVFTIIMGPSTNSSDSPTETVVETE